MTYSRFSVRRPLLGLLVGSTLLVPATGVAQRIVEYPVTDAFGYIAFDAGPVCQASFADIASTGTAVSLVASGAEPALDDGGATIPLAEPFELYGSAATALVVSTNGYLAVASSLGGEGGGDFSNDCPLPAVPEKGPASAARIAVLHDDLDGSGPAGPATDGTIHHQHFASCPRPSDVLGAESCTIIQWTDWRVLGTSSLFSMQAVLYHQSFSIVVQFAGADYTARPLVDDPAGATIGLQNASATGGLTTACGLRSLTMNGTAFCHFEPRFPPATGDLWVELDDKTFAPAPGGQLNYVVSVVGPGPGPLSGVALSMVVPPEITGCSWTCVASPGSSCTAAGSGPAVADTVDLAPGGAARYEAFCDLDASAAGGTVTVETTVAAPAGYLDPDLANNTASVTTDIPIPVTLQRFTVE